ncbi:MAG: hypothetical protein CMJ33_03005 [Phycisphaerae bacterium]|nr:hypothetical protein [Phycisphaerae bacterium]HAW96339.1 hypothetical protein [Phycisphaerales bacterium]
MKDAMKMIENTLIQGAIRCVCTLTTLAIMLGITGTANAQNVSVSFTNNQTWVDTPIQIVFTVENAEEFGEPVLPEVDGLKIRYEGALNRSSRITIINGKRQESRSVDLAISVTPTRAGTFVVPNIQLAVDGVTYNSSEVRLTAVAPVNDGKVLVEVLGPDNSVYVGESVTLGLQIWIEEFEPAGYDVEIPESTMWQLVKVGDSDWGPFKKSLEYMAANRQRPSGRSRMRDGRKYFVYEIERDIRPTGLGTIEGLGDVSVAVNYPRGVERSRSIFSSGLQFSGLIPLRVHADVSDIGIKPLPEEGKPEYFRGAVGKFVVKSSARPKDVAVGDPITLSFMVGNVRNDESVLDTLRPPPLHLMEALTSEFKIPSDPIAGTVDGDIKIFTQTLRARSADVEAIPPIPFAFFDPESETYQTIYTQPIPLTVSPAESLVMSDITRASGAETGKEETRTPSGLESAAEQGLAANFPVDVTLLKVNDGTIGVGTVILTATPPVAFCAIALLMARRRWRRSNPTVVLARSARSKAMRTLKAIGDLEESGRCVRVFISEKSHLPARSATTSEALNLARLAGADTELLHELDGFLRRSERAGYGRDDGRDVDARDEAIRLIGRLDRCRWTTPNGHMEAHS